MKFTSRFCSLAGALTENHGFQLRSTGGNAASPNTRSAVGLAYSSTNSATDLAVTVHDGESELLLPPTPFAWVKGDAERIWLGRLDHYPNVTIMSGAAGLIVNRFESEAHLRRWIIETERELAA